MQCSVDAICSVLPNTNNKANDMGNGREILMQAVDSLSEILVNHTIRIDQRATINHFMRIDDNLFRCIIKENLKPAGIALLHKDICCNDYDRPTVVVVGHLTDGLRKQAIHYGINILDKAGNCVIDSSPTLYLNIQGQKKEEKNNNTFNFRISGMAVLYYILSSERQKLDPFHDMAKKTGVSSSTVKHVVDTLLAHDFLFKTSNGFFLKRRQDLILEWADLFNKTIRPKIAMVRMRWGPISSNWQDVNLPDGVYWGGECGAFLLNQFMTPGGFEIYSSLSTKDLVSHGLFVPDPKGNIMVYKRFWENDAPIHPILLYADLINNNDGRSLEAADRLRHDFFND